MYGGISRFINVSTDEVYGESSYGKDKGEFLDALRDAYCATGLIPTKLRLNCEVGVSSHKLSPRELLAIPSGGTVLPRCGRGQHFGTHKPLLCSKGGGRDDSESLSDLLQAASHHDAGQQCLRAEPIPREVDTKVHAFSRQRRGPSCPWRRYASILALPPSWTGCHMYFHIISLDMVSHFKNTAHGH